MSITILLKEREQMILGKFMARFNKRGFTLIELIVVIAILAILAVTAVMAIGGVTDQARLASLQSEANTTVRALNLYNSLVSSGGTKFTDLHKPTVIELATLGVKAPPDMITMDLSLNIESARFDIIIGEDAVSGDPIIVYKEGSWSVSKK
jgi:prepilin-type N-terminal cleavage/methylation domain-containing protein